MIDFKEYLTKYRDIIDKEVAGYFYPIDIIMLYGALQRLQQYQVGDVCEIGIAKGKSAICLSDFKKENEILQCALLQDNKSNIEIIIKYYKRLGFVESFLDYSKACVKELGIM